MCHPHTTQELLQQEVSAIWHRYFKFSVPLQLQLDIPPSLVDQGVYIFREPQLSILWATQAHSVSTQLYTNNKLLYLLHPVPLLLLSYMHAHTSTIMATYCTLGPTSHSNTHMHIHFNNYTELQAKVFKYLLHHCNLNFTSGCNKEEFGQMEERVKKLRVGAGQIWERQLKPLRYPLLTQQLHIPYWTTMAGEGHEESILQWQQGVFTTQKWWLFSKQQMPACRGLMGI